MNLGRGDAQTVDFDRKFMLVCSLICEMTGFPRSLCENIQQACICFCSYDFVFYFGIIWSQGWNICVSLCAMLLDFTAVTQWYNQPVNLLLALNANVLINLLICFYSSTRNVQLFGS